MVVMLAAELGSQVKQWCQRFSVSVAAAVAAANNNNTNNTLLGPLLWPHVTHNRTATSVEVGQHE